MTRMADYAKALLAGLTDRLQPVEGGPMDGVLIVTKRDIGEVWALTEVPPPDENVAELTTPATVYLAARCHICGESATVTVDLESKTTVDDKRRVLAAKVDAGSVVHVCGQTTLPLRNVTPEAEGQTEAWDIEDLTGPEAPAPDVARLVDLLGRLFVTGADVAAWTDEERREAMRWAVAHHMAEVNGTALPARPDHVPAPNPPKPEAEEGPEPCPWPGCVKPANHGGRHKKAKATGGADDGAEDGPETPEDGSSADSDPDTLPE